ncbi:metallophosphoesterase family protein [Alkalibacterium sp. AK22]|uniref:metallophosphoesterase family protein n=1 Tax=Alkalibacterium sp. AK22 TaxID=1229520 RepID=UPI000559190E|nr:DNA repair exonuclease [Alkalibacterium sp. AK22]
MVRFIHAADLHLDSPYKGLKELSGRLADTVMRSTFQSLENIVEAAIEKKVDFVLFAGDIYDLKDRSIRAQVLFKQQMEKLKESGIRVFLIHGNHDFISQESDHLLLPDNVHVFDKAVETVSIETEKGEKVALSGFSYDKRWVDSRMITDYPDRLPQCDYHIGLLHGFEEGLKAEHARYAPFSLRELREKNYDYWALGHIHKRQQLCEDPPVYYSGNTQGRNRKETGDKGCLLVELTETKQQVDFLKTASIVWKEARADLSQLDSMNSIFEAIHEAVQSLPEQNTLLVLRLEVSPDLSDKILNKLKQDELRETLHQYETGHFIYVTQIKIDMQSTASSTFALAQLFPEEWDQTVQHLTTREAFIEVTKELFSAHAYARDVEEPNGHYRQEIIETAQALIRLDLGVEEDFYGH